MERGLFNILIIVILVAVAIIIGMVFIKSGYEKAETATESVLPSPEIPALSGFLFLRRKKSKKADMTMIQIIISLVMAVIIIAVVWSLIKLLGKGF